MYRIVPKIGTPPNLPPPPKFSTRHGPNWGSGREITYARSSIAKEGRGLIFGGGGGGGGGEKGYGIF